MQFFHVSITFVAQKLVVPAQIEKKVDFTTFEHYSQFISVFLIKKALFSKNFKISFWRIRLESESKVYKCQMFDFPPHIHTKWRVLTSWWRSSTMGPWRSIRVLFQRKHKKVLIFSFFANSVFFNQPPKK